MAYLLSFTSYHYVFTSSPDEAVNTFSPNIYKKKRNDSEVSALLSSLKIVTRVSMRIEIKFTSPISSALFFSFYLFLNALVIVVLATFQQKVSVAVDPC